MKSITSKRGVGSTLGTGVKACRDWEDWGLQDFGKSRVWGVVGFRFQGSGFRGSMLEALASQGVALRV